MKHNKKANKSIPQVGGKPASFKKISEEKTEFSNLPTAILKKYEPQIYVSKKKRPISHKDLRPTATSLAEAQKAIFLERMFVEKQRKSETLLISFPDQELSPWIVRSFSSNIDSVSFIHSAAPRYCYVKLRPGTNAEDEIARISKIPFQNGFLKAKLKPPLSREFPPVPKEVDATTLYVGNLPPDISVSEVREHFKRPKRIEIGYSLKKKWRRYALVNFQNSEEARNAFAASFESHIRNFALVVRFHRIKNWKVLEQLELENDIMRAKIKEEADDGSYDAVVKRSQEKCDSGEGGETSRDKEFTQLAPVRYPFVRPFVDLSLVKQEPISPKPSSKEVCQSPNRTNREDSWNEYMELYRSMLSVQQLSKEQDLLQHQEKHNQSMEEKKESTEDANSKDRYYPPPSQNEMLSNEPPSFSPAKHENVPNQGKPFPPPTGHFKGASSNWPDKFNKFESKRQPRIPEAGDIARKKPKKRRWQDIEPVESSQTEMPTSSIHVRPQSFSVSQRGQHSRPQSQGRIPSLLNLNTMTPLEFKLKKDLRKGQQQQLLQRSTHITIPPFKFNSNELGGHHKKFIPSQQVPTEVGKPPFETPATNSNKNSKRPYSFIKRNRKK